jgi:hypothetical protein
MRVRAAYMRVRGDIYDCEVRECTEKRHIHRTPGLLGGPPDLLEENDPAGRVLLVMASLECFPCVSIFLGMKHWTA